MKKKIEVGNLDVTVRYRRGMKHIYLRVEKNAYIVVSAPPRTPNYVIRKLVYDNLEELVKRRENILSVAGVSREYKTGEKYFIFGQEYELNVEERLKNRVFIENNKINIYVKDEQQNKEKIFNSAIRKLLIDKCKLFIEKYEPIMNVKVKELRIKKMKTRWGTCNLEAQRIWINQELIKYPIECLEHIIVHEMTHLLEINHTPRFYSLLETYYPTYKKNDKVIKEFNRFLNGR